MIKPESAVESTDQLTTRALIAGDPVLLSAIIRPLARNAFGLGDSHGNKAVSPCSAVRAHVHRGPAVLHRQSRGRDSDIREESWLCRGIYLRRRGKEWY